MTIAFITYIVIGYNYTVTLGIINRHYIEHKYMKFSTLDIKILSQNNPYTIKNLVFGVWQNTTKTRNIIDPLNGEEFIKIQDTTPEDFFSFVESLKSCPKSGRHNPFSNIERYKMLAEVSRKTAEKLKDPEIEDFFATLIMRVMPKSYAQCLGEVRVTADFFANFSSDQVRFLARGFSNPGDHEGQESRGYRWPYGPVVIISPFNFPLEIPALQLMGALFMGNKPLIKGASTTAIVIEQLLHLLHYCGLPKKDVDFINCSGKNMSLLLEETKDIIRLTQFTGSSKTANEICQIMNGKVRLEDAGFDWKILGADCKDAWVPYVSWQSDQDAYAASGQKCSAQSILFAHENWVKAGLLEQLKNLAGRRRLADLTVGPVLSWTTEEMLEHIVNLLRIPGAKLLFGGKPLVGHTIPKKYGAIEPTALYIPIEAFQNFDNFKLATKEIFGPFQIITTYATNQLSIVLEACEKMDNHLTAAVVSTDQQFINRVLGATVNGTTYAGLRARTTGAPQNHWFGPAGDPRSAGIGTKEAIQQTWSCHREIIFDQGPITQNWGYPNAT